MFTIVTSNLVFVSLQQHSSFSIFMSYTAPTTNNNEACQNITIMVVKIMTQNVR